MKTEEVHEFSCGSSRAQLQKTESGEILLGISSTPLLGEPFPVFITLPREMQRQIALQLISWLLE